MISFAGTGIAPSGAMKRRHLIILCLASLLSVTGCRSLLNVENPDYSILRVVPRVALAFPFERSSIDLEFLIEVDNPNDFALNLDRVDFDLFIDRQKVIQGISNRQIRVPANGVGEVSISTRLDYASLRGVFREVMEVVRGGDPNYELRGKAHYKTPLGSVALPFQIYK